MKYLAKTFSAVLHPVLIPCYAMLLFLYNSNYSYMLNPKAKIWMLAMVFAFTLLLPMLFILLLRLFGTVSSISLPDSRERRAPLLFSAISVYFCHIFFRQISTLPNIFSKLFLALSVLLLLLAIITIFWKISLHMAAIGGLFTVTLLFATSVSLVPLLILLSGILGTARLVLQAHSPAQVYGGFFLGSLFFAGFFLL